MQVQVFDSNELALATGGQWEGDPPPAGSAWVAFDTRNMPPGAWYLALKGAVHDGHRFASQALEAGAKGVIAEQGAVLALPANTPVLRVANSTEALGGIARFHRRRWGGPVLALTGSSGKTTTKELVAAALAIEGPCHATLGNQNNEIGVPLTLLGLRPEHQAAVVEMGMRGQGQIAQLATWAEAEHGLITNVGVAHLELLGSTEAIAQAKAELWAVAPHALALAPSGPNPEALAPHLAKHPGPQLLYGLEEEAQACVAAAQAQPLEGGRMRVKVLHRPAQGPVQELWVEAPGWGEHQRRNVAAAVAARVALGRPWLPELVLQPRALAGRQAVRDVCGVRLVDDAYNANPNSLLAAAEAFASEPGPWVRRWLVVGRMAELGPLGPELHAQAGQKLATLGFAGMWAVGEGAEAYVAKGAEVQVIPDLEQASQSIADALAPGDTILFKASRSVGLERLVEAVAMALARKGAAC